MRTKALKHTFKIHVPLDILTSRLYSKALRIALVGGLPENYASGTTIRAV
jgi:hypothetical protein